MTQNTSPTWQDKIDDLVKRSAWAQQGWLEQELKVLFAQELQQARKEAIEEAIAEIENIKIDPKNAGWKDAVDGLKVVITHRLQSLLPQNESLT